MYTAIIVEPRKHKALEFVIKNMLNCLSPEWEIVLFHGTKNVDYSKKIVDTMPRVRTVQLNVDNLDRHTYSELFTTNLIYDHIPTEMFLVFQTDSMMFKQNAHLMDSFLEYDYVGAPWRVTEYPPTMKCNFIGNGGFSLRRKSKMLEIIAKHQRHDMPEDLFFSTHYDDITLHKPEYNKALTFCMDEMFHETVMATHNPWSNSNYDFVVQHYPEIKELRQLQEVEN